MAHREDLPRYLVVAPQELARRAKPALDLGGFEDRLLQLGLLAAKRFELRSGRLQAPDKLLPGRQRRAGQPRRASGRSRWHSGFGLRVHAPLTPRTCSPRRARSEK